MTPPVEILLAALVFVAFAGMYPYPLRSGARWIDLGGCALVNTAVYGAGWAAFATVKFWLPSLGDVGDLAANLAGASAGFAAAFVAASLTGHIGWLQRAGARVAAAQRKTERRLARGDRPEGRPLVFRE